MFLMMLSIRQLTIGIHYLCFEKYLLNRSFEQSTFSILLLPLIYLYFKNLSMGIESFNGIEFLKNYIFPVLFFVMISYQTYFIQQDKAIPIDLIGNLIPFIFSLGYLFMCFKILSKNIWSRRKSNIASNSLVKRWTKLLFISISLMAIRYLFVFSLKLYSNTAPALFNYHPLTSIMILIICFKILYSPEILYGYTVLNATINENRCFELKFDNIWDVSNNTMPKNLQDKALKNKIDSAILKYCEQLEQMALENDFLTKSDITLNDIANKLNIPKSHLIYVFKYHSKVTFIEFKKIVRVYYATKLIHDNFLKANTLNCLSKKVGFSSYDPFYRSFKEIIGNGPLDYYNTIRVNNLNQ